MIVIRDIFRLKFGQSKDATTHWKEAVKALKQSGYGVVDVRLLTDLAGAPYYTIVLESTFKSVADWEKAHSDTGENAPWKSIYAKIIPLTEEGRREIFRVIA